MPIAIGAFLEIDIVMIGLIAIILLFAGYSIYRPVVVDVLGNLPGIGGAVARIALSLLDRAVSAAQSWAQAATAPAQFVIDRVWADLHFNAWHVSANLDQFYNWVHWIQKGLIPYYVGKLSGLIDLTFTQSLQFTQLLVTQTQMLARLFFTQSLMYAQQIGLNANLYATQVGLAAQQFARLLFSQALGYTEARVVGAEGYARDLVQGADAYARQLQGEALQFTRDGVVDAERFAAGVGADAEGYARALHNLAIGHADAVGAATALFALSLARPLADAIVRVEDSPCFRYCNPLGDLGRLAQGLEEAGLAAFLIGMVAEGIRDPSGTAKEINGVLGPIMRETGDTLRDLVGAGQSR